MRRVVVLASLCVLLCAGLMLWGFSGGTAPAQPAGAGRVLLLVDSDRGSFLMQLRKGLQEAVAQQGGSLSVETLGSLPLSDLAAASFRAFYLWMADPGPSLDTLAALGVPAIVLDRALRGQRCLAFHEEEGGRLLGQLALDGLGAGGIVIVADTGDEAQAERLKGVQEALGEREYLLQAPAKLDLAGLRGAACVIALSGGAVDRLAALKREGALPAGLPLYGVQAEENRVRYLEEGLLQGIAVTSPYALGYAAGGALQAIAAGDFKPTLTWVPLRLVTLETLYDAGNVKEMFPLLQ